MRLQEVMRLQGLGQDFPVCVSEASLHALLGNSMSVKILERVLARLLPAAQLTGGQPLLDRYAGELVS